MNQGINKKEQGEKKSIEEIISRADMLSMDNIDSRLIQKRYEDCSAEDKTRIFNKLKSDIYPLSKDMFGNNILSKKY